jgi:hypothetical protein
MAEFFCTKRSCRERIVVSAVRMMRSFSARTFAGTCSLSNSRSSLRFLHDMVWARCLAFQPRISVVFSQNWSECITFRQQWQSSKTELVSSKLRSLKKTKCIIYLSSRILYLFFARLFCRYFGSKSLAARILVSAVRILRSCFSSSVLLPIYACAQ